MVLEPHPNADSLSIVRVFTGYTVVVRTADWIGKDRGVYIPPDSVVPTSRPEFDFLGTGEAVRVKVKKLRGVPSMGLLVAMAPLMPYGTDLAAYLGVTHYVPPTVTPMGGGQGVAGPAVYAPKYDLDSLRRYADLFVPGEDVVVTEKIHGANARFCFFDGKMHVGSRSQWVSEPSVWHTALKNAPELYEYCKNNPGFVVYGEVFGPVQDLRYGLSMPEVRVFDVLTPDGFLNSDELFSLPMIPLVPVLYRGEFQLDRILSLAEGLSLVPTAHHVREGCVVRPTKERIDPRLGRVHLKVVGNGYLERS